MVIESLYSSGIQTEQSQAALQAEYKRSTQGTESQNTTQTIQETDTYSSTEPSQATYNRNGKLPVAAAEEETDLETENEEVQEESIVAASESGENDDKLTIEEKEVVQELSTIDREVRQHEQAHMAAAAGLSTGGIHYAYERGPDGEMYAVGGDVVIDTSGGSTPQETIAKMQKVRSAALAPADPSPQDRRVAAEASSRIAEAGADLASEQVKSQEQEKENDQSVQEAQDTGQSSNQQGMAAYQAAGSDSLNTSTAIDFKI